MRNIFSTSAFKKPETNVFDLSHDVKMSLQMGQLVPFACMEAMPGDKFELTTECMLRMAPMISPVMHKVDLYQHFFFVPNRILWSGWRDFIAPKTEGASAPAAPYFINRVIDTGSLGDYLGLPTGGVAQQINALPFAAYNAIYNEYYRDQNLVTEVPFQLSDGDNTASWSSYQNIRLRAWQHDYFTSCLPWPQKGPEVLLPLGDKAPVFKQTDSFGGDQIANWNVTRQISGTADQAIVDLKDRDGVDDLLYADLEDATAASINDLRLSIRLQEYYERLARGGSRYIEVIRSFFGVRSSDARLQRPEYITGNKQSVIISEVLQTGQSDTTPQGNMAGHGISVGRGGDKSYFCEEHGWIIGIMSVMPRSAYQQGLHKMWSRLDRLDYAWPVFAHLGEQEVLNKEVYYNDADGDNNETFGYMPRYQEYRFVNSRVAGDMRGSLNFWHMGRIFTGRPLLNQDFIEMDQAEVSRIFAVTDPNVDKLYAHIFNNVKAVRKLPLFGVPEL